jgi:hypothetical protein
MIGILQACQAHPLPLIETKPVLRMGKITHIFFLAQGYALLMRLVLSGTSIRRDRHESVMTIVMGSGLKL